MDAKIWQFFVLAKHLVEILRFTACLQACLSVQGKAAVSLRLPALPVPAPFEAKSPLVYEPARVDIAEIA